MYQHTETITLSSSIIYTIYQMSFASDVFINVVNANTFAVEYSLERIGGRYNSLFQTQFAVDNEKGLIYFSPSAVGLTIKITYYTDGKVNPFHASENLFQTVTRIITWSNKRILDGLYIYIYDEDPEHIKRVARGSIVYNDNIYVSKENILNFNELSPPRMTNVYRGYLLFINDTILDDELDINTKIINNIGRLTSTGVHDSTLAAKNDLLNKYHTLYPNFPILTIAYMYQKIVVGNSREFIVDYDHESRVL